MTMDADATIVPAEFPELSRLVWNRDPDVAIPARDAFSIYERNWRFVDKAALSESEARLIRELTKSFGNGVLLAS